MAWRVMWGVGAMLGLTGVEVVGFIVVAGAKPLDALSMTVVTITTVGSNQVVPLNQGGRILAMGLIISSLTAIGNASAVAVEYLLRGHLLARVTQRRREQALAAMRRPFHRRRIRTRGPRDRKKPARDRAIGGDDRTRRRAVRSGRESGRANGLRKRRLGRSLACRWDRPGGRDTRCHGKGCQQHPYRGCGAEPMASYALTPDVAWALSELLGTKSKDMTIEEVAIASGSSYAGQNIGDVRLRHHRVAVMAIGRNAGQRFRSPWEETICAGDVLTMIGPPPNVQQFAQQAGK